MITYKLEAMMIKKWISSMKQKLCVKWAKEYGYHIIQIKVVAGTEYLVDSEGAMRKLAKVRG